MEKKATAVEAIIIRGEERLPDGVTALKVDCYDFDAYQALPSVVEFDGRLFGKTGWNSDTGLGCYRDDCRVARAA